MKGFFFIVLLLTSALSFSQSKVTEVNQLHKQKFEWLIHKNYDSLNWIMDEQIKFIHSNGWIQNKQDVINDLKSGKLNYTSIVIQESSVVIYNQTAVVTGKGNFKGLMPDQSEFNIKLLYTEVYSKSKKQWKLVSRQATKI